MTKLRAKWIAFLCWFLDHHMKVVVEDVDWCIVDRLKECERCGLQVYERHMGPF